MLIFTRHVNEKIMIGEDIIITVTKIRGNQVVIGIDAPKNINIVRTELLDKQREKNGQRN
jgi:carbon storage regulator